MPSTAPYWPVRREFEVGVEFITGEKIISTVCCHFGVTFDQVNVISRKSESRWPRQLIMYFMVKHTILTLKQIGEKFNRHHTTVINSREAVQDLIDTNDNVAKEVNALSEKIRA